MMLSGNSELAEAPSSAVTIPKRTAPKRRAPSFREELMFFALPSTPDLSCASHVWDHLQSVGSGSSQQSSRFCFRPSVTFGSQDESPSIEGQQDWSTQESARGGEGPTGSHIEVDPMLGQFCIIL